ncbi:MFS transporter [Nostoc sp.]
MQLQNKLVQKIPRTVWVLGFVSLLTDTSSEMIHSVLPLFLVSVLGANIWTVGIIEGIAEATASILKVFSGVLSDYLGHRKGLAVFGYGLSTFVKPLFAVATSPTGVLIARFGGGFLLYALVYLGFAFVQTPWQAWGLFALYGLYLGMSQGLLLALVANSIPANLRGTAFGFLNLAVGLALLPASLLAGGLWQTLGAEATFITGSLFALA